MLDKFIYIEIKIQKSTHFLPNNKSLEINMTIIPKRIQTIDVNQLSSLIIFNKLTSVFPL